MAADVTIHGTCDPPFARVREAFAENFAQHGEVGASVAVTIDNRPVIDLWGGYADAARSQPWQRDTIVIVYSTTKGVTALCAHLLVERGQLDVDAPVARYWPEFAAAGKAEMPVRFLLSHRAGLPAIAKPLAVETLYDWAAITGALAEQEPWWEPGTQHGYHAFTFGYLVGEVIRRIAGKSVGAFLRDEVAVPLGIDCHIGLAAEHDVRVAETIAAPPPPPGAPDWFREAAKNAGAMTYNTHYNPHTPAPIRNTRAWRAAEMPAANAHTNARALARLYGVLACGGQAEGARLLSPATIDRAITEESNGPDATLFGVPTRFGLGFMLTQPACPFGPNPRAFGHPGAGGSLGFADPDARIGFGYTMNQMQDGLPVDPRAVRMIDALYETLRL